MSTDPVITIFVRHSEGCKYEADEFSKRCDCRKHLRWFRDGKLHRRPAKTRSWSEAEDVKREIVDQLSGRTTDADNTAKSIPDAIALFIKDKQVQGAGESAISKYVRDLGRLRNYCEGQLVFTVQGINRELLTGYMATWEAVYPSSVTRSKTREQLRGFLRYCYECGWQSRIPVLPKIKVDAVPTLPLTEAEFNHLLGSIPVALAHPQAAPKRVKVRALLLLMRWSGLAILDALSLRRSDIKWDGKVYRVVTSRQKTGVDVSVPIPPDVAKEIIAVPNEANSTYLFLSGNSKPKNTTTKWQTRFILPVFKAAGLYGDGHMVSHRLRDTFACDLLEKGVPIQEVSKLLGHTSIRTTEKSYSAWVQGRQDRLDALVIGTWGTSSPPAKRKGRVGRVVAIA